MSLALGFQLALLMSLALGFQVGPSQVPEG